MEEALQAWKRTSPDLFKERVIDQRVSTVLSLLFHLFDFQNHLLNRWKESLSKSSLSQSAARSETALTGDILCRACGYQLGSLAQLRQYGTSFFIHADDFYNRIEEKAYAEPEEFAKTRVTGEDSILFVALIAQWSIWLGTASCGNKSCRAKLGLINKLKDYPRLGSIYPLKCKSVKIKQTDLVSGEVTMLLKSQWKQMPFSVALFTNETTQADEVFYDACDSFISHE